MSSATSTFTSGYSSSDSSSVDLSEDLDFPTRRDQAVTREQDDSDGDGNRDAEDLALSSPERSPAPSDHGSSVNNSHGVTDDGGDSSRSNAAAGVNAVQQQQQQQQQQREQQQKHQQQSTVPYIKTLEEIYRVVDSLTNSPVDAVVGTNNTNTNITERRQRESHQHQHHRYHTSLNRENPDTDSSDSSDSEFGRRDDYDHDDGFYDIPLPRRGPDATCPACATPYDIAAADPISLPISLPTSSTPTSFHPHPHPHPSHNPHQYHNLHQPKFRSTLHLLYNDALKHTWALGSRFVVTETSSSDDSQPGGPEVALAEAARMLRATTRVPVPEVLAAWKEGDGRVVTVCERVGGSGGGGNGGNGGRNGGRTSRLYDVWWEITAVERERLARRVAGYAEQWRRNYSDAISSISGYPIVRGYETLLGSGRGVCFDGDEDDDGGVGGGGGEEESVEEGFPHCRSDIEFWGAIEERLLRRRRKTKEKDRQKNKKTIDEYDETMRVLKEYMPESYPCVLTHGDLSTRNILVEMPAMNHGGGTGVEVAGILGFENAASLPVWAEGVCARFCYCREDEQWKALLSRYLPSSGNAAAFDWWRLWRAVRGDDDDAVAGGADARGFGRDKIKEARIRMLRERCRRWPKPPQERRAFNAARTEPGARQVPRREPGAASAAASPVTDERDGDEGGRAMSSPVAAQPLRGEVEGEDVSAGIVSDYVSRRESLALSSPGLRRPVFNPEPIRFSDPEHDGDDEKEASGDINHPEDGNGDKPVGLQLAGASQPSIISRSREQERPLDKNDKEQLGEHVRNDDERPPDGNENQNELRDKRATWHTSKFMESNELLGDRHNDSTEPINTVDTTELAGRPHSLGRSQNTSPNPSAAEGEQRIRGRPLNRNSSTKRTSMRSFGPQVTLQPLTLQPLNNTTTGRPQSLPPVANAISAADMEKLRDTGKNDSNNDNINGKSAGEHDDGQGFGDIPPRLRDQGTEGEAPPSTNINKNARDALPTIREHPATPRRPTMQRPSGSRARPASLYGTLQAWGQKNRAGTGSGLHKRAHSEMALLRSNSSPQRSLRSHRTTVIRAPPGSRSGPEHENEQEHGDVGIYDHHRPEESRGLSGDRSRSRGRGRGGGITWDTNHHDPRKNGVDSPTRSQSHG